MKTVFSDYFYTYEIERSKFIGILFPITSLEDFKEKLNKYKKEYPKATHYCYAYILNGLNKSNDDGEPSGTAGSPILENLLRKDLNNVGLLVIRYFGGIKLGTGGLIRAYNKTALETISVSKISEIIKTKSYLLKYDYSLNNVVTSYIKKIDAYEASIEYKELIERKIATNQDINELFSLCNGKITIINENDIDVIKNS